MEYPIHYVVNFLILKDNKILLEEDPKIGWKLPGGHIENNEEPSEAVKREVLEELGISIEFLSRPTLFISDDVQFLPVPFEMVEDKVERDSGLKVPHKNIALIYLVTTHDEPFGKEGQKIKWFSENEIENNVTHKAVKLICTKGLQLSKK